MRKLLLAAAAGLLAVPALAFAQDSGYGSDVNQPSIDQNQNQDSSKSGDVKQFPEAGSDVRTAMPAGDVSAQSQQLFQGKVKTWDIKGTVSNVDSSKKEITIQRENLPDAQLSLVDNTKITMDGKQASMMDLQQGAEVRAEFQLAQDKPVAMKVDAKPSKAMKDQKGSTSKDMNKGSKSGSTQDSGTQH
jgi:Cu/Ag efflux protein CusF